MLDELYETHGDWKLVSKKDNTVLLKVIKFPTTAGNESMWVECIDGDDYEGIGLLDNKPFGDSSFKLGDLILYGDGSDESKPEYKATWVNDGWVYG